MKYPIGRFHVLVDNVTLAEAAITGGADTIQYRDKNVPTGQMIETARALRKVCTSAGLPLIVNDRADVALAAKADGVHLGQDDLSIAVARRLLGPSKLIGRSTSTYYEAMKAQREGTDYLSCGHIFPTTSKVKPYPARGVRFLEDLCRSMTTPVIAIGGIDTTNAADVMDAGAWGIAVIAAVRDAANPQEAARALSSIIRAESRR